MTHLGVVYRHHPVPAHSLLQTHPVFGALNVLKQQLPEQFGRWRYPLAHRAVLFQKALGPTGQLQKSVAIRHYLSKQR